VQEQASGEMDGVSSTSEASGSTQSTADGSSKSEGDSSTPKKSREGKKSALRRYIDSFDAETTKQMTSIMSLEAVRLLSRQSKALWGDLEELTVELREVRACFSSDAWYQLWRFMCAQIFEVDIFR
jgi:hypothetical protein